MDNGLFINCEPLGTLRYLFVLVEEIRPVLFFCSDEMKSLFVCLLCMSCNDKTEWIVLPVEANRIIDLLTDKISFYQLFKDSHGEAYIVTT